MQTPKDQVVTSFKGVEVCQMKRIARRYYYAPSLGRAYAFRSLPLLFVAIERALRLGYVAEGRS